MKIAATIQARTGSSRLPRKVLLPIVGKPMLAHQVERIKRSQLIDEVIIATTTNPDDDPLVELADQLGVRCFRGSEDLVLDRIVSALQRFEVDVNVESYGDSQLVDPTIIDMIIGLYLKHQDAYDYVTSGVKTTFPPGLEVIVYPSRVLYDAQAVARPEERELVSVNIISRPERYRILNVEAPPWYRYPDLHLEVDTAEDFRVISAIYEALYPSNPYFVLSDVIDFLKQNPALAESNRHVPRRWKAYRQDD